MGFFTGLVVGSALSNTNNHVAYYGGGRYNCYGCQQVCKQIDEVTTKCYTEYPQYSADLFNGSFVDSAGSVVVSIWLLLLILLCSFFLLGFLVHTARKWIKMRY